MNSFSNFHTINVNCMCACVCACVCVFVWAELNHCADGTFCTLHTHNKWILWMDSNAIENTTKLHESKPISCNHIMTHSETMFLRLDSDVKMPLMHITSIRAHMEGGWMSMGQPVDFRTFYFYKVMCRSCVPKRPYYYLCCGTLCIE